MTLSKQARASRELVVLEQQIAELFVVADRRVVDDRGLQLLDVPAAREDLERRAQQARVGDDFERDVDERAEAAADDDDPEPVRIGPTAREVRDRERLQDDAVWIEEAQHARRVYISLIEMLRNWTSAGGLVQTPPFFAP